MKNGFVHFFCLYAFTLCMAYFFVITVACLKGIALSSDVKEVTICIIGICGSIVGYIVGSTIGSRNKDAIIKNSLNGGTPPINNTP